MTQARTDGLLGLERRRHALGGMTLSHRIACTLPDEIDEHTHDDAHFVLVTGGRYISSAGGDAPGHFPVFIYNPPGTRHRDRFDPNLGSYFAISIEASRLTALAGDGALPQDAVHVRLQAARRAMNRILGACRHGADSDLLLEGLCLELVDCLVPGKAEKPPSWMDRALALIADRCADDLSVADVAAAAGVHPMHLTRSFRVHLGCTPGELLRRHRLERATGLLTATDMPLVEIALGLGFPDQTNFTHRFGETYGVPPGAYRKLTRRGRRTLV